MMVKKILILVIAVVFFSCKDEDLLIPTTMKPLTSVLLTGIAGEASDPLIIQILDQAGRPLENAEVKFEVISGLGSLSNAVSTTDVNGTAFTYVRFGKSKADVVVQATAPQITDTLTFRYRISLSRASKINIVSGNNQEGLGGKLLKDELVVSVTDDFNNQAKGVYVKFVVTEGNGVLSETSSFTDVAGMARTRLTLSSTTPKNTIQVMTAGDTTYLSARSYIPSQLSQAIKTDYGVHLQWERSLNQEFISYSLQRATMTFLSPFFVEIATFNDVATTSFEDNTVNPGTQYQYKVVVKVKNNFGEIASDVRQIDAGNYIALAGTAGGVAIDNVRKRIYVSITYRNEIQVFDLESYQLLDAIYVGSMPMGINLSHDNTTLIIALNGSGDVAFLNLDTKQIRTVDVEAALGYSTVYGVIEAAPGKVFVTADPGDTGDGYLVRILTDNNDSVQRCSSVTMRGTSTLQADYGNRLMILKSGFLQVIDPTNLTVLGSNGSTSATQFVYSSTTNELYLNTAVMSLAPLAIKRTFPSRKTPGISPGGSLIHFVDGTKIISQSISSNATVTQIPAPLNLDFVLQFQISSDNRQLVILCIIGGNYRLFFIKRPLS